MPKRNSKVCPIFFTCVWFLSTEFILLLHQHSETKWPTFWHKLQVMLLSLKNLLFPKYPLFLHLSHLISLFLSFKVISNLLIALILFHVAESFPLIIPLSVQLFGEVQERDPFSRVGTAANEMNRSSSQHDF